MSGAMWGSELSQDEQGRGRTHQVDWAADVAVHERHEAVHQVTGKEEARCY